MLLTGCHFLNWLFNYAQLADYRIKYAHIQQKQKIPENMKQYEIRDLKIGETDLEIWGTFHKGESGSHFQPAISNRFEINYIYHDGNDITDKIEDYIKNPVNPDDFPNDLASYLDNDFMDLLETKILDKW